MLQHAFIPNDVELIDFGLEAISQLDTATGRRSMLSMLTHFDCSSRTSSQLPGENICHGKK